MTKKDHMKIAIALNEEWQRQMSRNMRSEHELRVIYDVMMDVTWKILTMLENDNPEFDKELFREIVGSDNSGY